jgi:hypothetical protein
MNNKIKFSIFGLILAVLILVIISFQLHVPQQSEIIKPLPAILKVDGKEQMSGISSYCWNGVFSSVCADYAGIPTISEPLPAKSPVTAHLSLPLKEPPEELQLKVVQVTNKDVLETGGGNSQFWRSSDGKSSNPAHRI